MHEIIGHLERLDAWPIHGIIDAVAWRFDGRALILHHKAWPLLKAARKTVVNYQANKVAYNRKWRALRRKCLATRSSRQDAPSS